MSFCATRKSQRRIETHEASRDGEVRLGLARARGIIARRDGTCIESDGVTGKKDGRQRESLLVRRVEKDTKGRGADATHHPGRASMGIPRPTGSLSI